MFPYAKSAKRKPGIRGTAEIQLVLGLSNHLYNRRSPPFPAPWPKAAGCGFAFTDPATDPLGPKPCANGLGRAERRFWESAAQASSTNASNRAFVSRGESGLSARPFAVRRVLRTPYPTKQPRIGGLRGTGRLNRRRWGSPHSTHPTIHVHANDA